jgi:hypothetical protein
MLFLMLGSLSAQITHSAWSVLLKKNVSQEGYVDYLGFQRDSLRLNAYLEMLSNNPPQKSWSANDTKAYWINAYNAFTVQLMTRHWPVKSIKDLGGFIYRVNTTWDIEFIRIGTQKVTLNYIEHKRLRGDFEDYRIHFAVNCASVSCPKLRNEAFEAATLDQQLEDQARSFINNPLKNDLSNSRNPRISKIFDWYSSDFEKSGNSVLKTLSKYSKKPVAPDAETGYLEYHWQPNIKSNY